MIVDEHPVRVVFNHQHVVPRQTSSSAIAIERQRGPERIVEVGDVVERAHGPVAAAPTIARLQRIGIQALVARGTGTTRMTEQAASPVMPM